MHVLLIVIGALLLLFGGGCGLFIGGAIVLGDDPLQNFQNTWSSLFVLGIVPLFAGIFLMRLGLRIDREKRRASWPPGDGA